jgi:hypothetical protein
MTKKFEIYGPNRIVTLEVTSGFDDENAIVDVVSNPKIKRCDGSALPIEGTCSYLAEQFYRIADELSGRDMCEELVDFLLADDNAQGVRDDLRTAAKMIDARMQKKEE